MFSMLGMFFIRDTFGVTDVTILENQKEHYPVIEIRFKECRGKISLLIFLCLLFLETVNSSSRGLFLPCVDHDGHCVDDGIDTRVHGIKMMSIHERDLGLNIDVFKRESLVRFPRLENIDVMVLYRRATLLNRCDERARQFLSCYARMYFYF